MSQVHVRFEGQSLDYPFESIDVGELSTDQEVKQNVATAMASDLDRPSDTILVKLSNFRLDRNSTGDITLRPQASFG